jgi:hypothetical protein
MTRFIMFMTHAATKNYPEIRARSRGGSSVTPHSSLRSLGCDLPTRNLQKCPQKFLSARPLNVCVALSGEGVSGLTIFFFQRPIQFVFMGWSRGCVIPEDK